MLLDTNIFIDFNRGYQPAKDFIYNTQINLETSAVCLMEYIRGTKNIAEANKFEEFLNKRSVEIIHITKEMSLKALELYKNNFHVIRLSYIDAIILATASIRNLSLGTRNIKHLSFCKDVKVIEPYK
ncbi:hypothetical protein COT50_02375 [candidate division WWE3 bacterium CG08_land_8_20_14_0_20_41_10]|uniref:PIN domain-containing protein n=1 Tax=candidate division WWE3 bacterium CG08_land_8_20_14_0_20_41_10 TaxID=1975085 RepID=A0A2H0XBQ7_UNCKA|nr:MAG: hypothetical protein COT50_02375 [candidate division WWE3 bacterium CG08_land_8_20_14_0_20_41_10]